MPWGGREWTEALGRGAGETGLPSPEIPGGAGSAAREDALGFRSTPPEPREQPGLRDSTSSGPTRLGLEIRRRGRPSPGPSARRSGAASRPAALPSPGSLRATVAAVRPSTPFPRDKPGGRYPAWPAPRGSGEPAAGPAATAATSALPARRRARPPSPRALPAGRSPGAPSPGWHHSHPQRARTRISCSTYLQSLLISHHHMPWKRGRPGTLRRAAASPSASGRR